ncbi:aminoacyl-tRNA hydrolase [Thioalkalivibrio sulfidiphilus]|uniref:Peptidyl-tRNA hydrolase n=1 Tax=Thioalkalivibrio sulfidiphilus (strain HL-EbGR7) TaxID=396588 RepID=B8GLA8_THISH|nr:aminoacyl-tRNA hydrolase [Thioalkalivibrio sulfidiphilus]ACL71626.1 Aminoacyl-tRNA hydrolase [Thioalkalivibrio sulfidiphilus HL-EbGr7]
MPGNQPVQLVAGLGNPGPKYTETRHNAGFWFVDALARRHGGTFRQENKFAGESARISLGGQEVWLLKPQTFMNRSGQSVKLLATFYKIPVESILVVHDELDLPPGEVRLKRGGGHGGHNGLRDIMAHLGKEFLRLRLGVGHPGHKDQVVDYVLQRPSRDEEADILRAIDHGLDVMSEVIAGELERAMHKLHSK